MTIYDGYTHNGYAIANQRESAPPTALTTSWSFFALDVDDGQGPSGQKGFFPRECMVDRLEVRITGMGTGASLPTSITAGLFRTANLDYPITDWGDPAYTEGIRGGTTANTGSAIFGPGLRVPHYELAGVTVDSSSAAPYDAVTKIDPDERKAFCRLYVGIKLNNGTATLGHCLVPWAGSQVSH